MSPRRPETDPRALAHRAAEELAAGGYLAAQTTALVAIALALAARRALADTEGAQRTIWAAYYSDFSGIAVFHTEIEAHRHASGKSMDVIELKPGDVQDQIRASWQR